jgi:hypothetical protein
MSACLCALPDQLLLLLCVQLTCGVYVGMLGVGGVSVSPASLGGGSCGPVPIAASLA